MCVSGGGGEGGKRVEGGWGALIRCRVDPAFHTGLADILLAIPFHLELWNISLLGEEMRRLDGLEVQGLGKRREFV